MPLMKRVLSVARVAAVTALLVAGGFLFGPVYSVLLLASMVMLQVVIHRPEWLRPGVWPPALIAFGAGYFATGDAEAKLGFYTITAQVVPALFIALAVQIQAFMRRRPRAEDRHAAVVTALALVLAEYSGG
jgi:hypothetical protein